MLNDWLKRENIQIVDSCSDWKESIKKVGEPLIVSGIIESRYIQAIYDMHEKVGPYYVLAPGISMPHSRPEDGANEVGLSLLLVRKGVEFYSDGNDPVKLIVMLAAKDSESHIEAISALSELLGEDSDVEAIMSCETVDEIKSIIDKY